MTPVKSRSHIALEILTVLAVVGLLVFGVATYSSYESARNLRREAEKTNPSALQFPVGFVAIRGVSPQPCGTAERTSTVPDTMTAGDVVLISLVFDCNTANLQASLRDDKLEVQPVLHAPGFDVDQVETTPFVDRDFYCITAFNDPTCSGDSTTKPEALKWTWSLRPQSAGRHILVFALNSHRVGAAPDQFVGAPVYFHVSSIDVRDPWISQISNFSGVFAAISGFFALLTVAYQTVRKWLPAKLSGGTEASRLGMEHSTATD